MQANKNSHTTSTKCQYQAANSNPRCCLRFKLPGKGTQEADGQKYRSNDHVETMKTRRHEKGRAKDRAFESEWRMGIFVGLNRGEGGAKQNRQR